MRVAIAEDPARRRVVRKRLDQLLRGPRGGRMLRHVEVHDPSTMVQQDDEDEQDATRDGRHGEEVDRADRGDMIREEGSPGLRRWPSRPPHQPRDRSF